MGHAGSTRIGDRIGVAAAVCAALLSGCGGGTDPGPTTYRVSGTVEFDGKPVPAGTIHFDPAAGTAGPQGRATIEDGAFDTSDGGKGITGGRYLVRIIGADGNETAAMPIGAPLFVEHAFESDLPAEDSVQEFVVPKTAADNLAPTTDDGP